MGLRILTGRDGKPRGTWYGRISVKGSMRETNLNVPIAGTIPVDDAGNVLLSAKGDEAFERSRKAAQKAFDTWRKAARTDPAELEQKAYKARTGVSLDGLPLAKLPERWLKQKRGYTPTAKWRQMTETWFARFAAFAAAYAKAHGGKRCETINDITPDIAAAWFADIKKTHAWETVTKMMGLMRGAYKRYATNGRANPFEDIVMRNRETQNAKVPHKPLTAAETERLFDCARDDAELYPLIVTAACTGMRVGDVCNLRWADVDLHGGFINVVTAKAGVRATIPIFGRLGDVLAERSALPADGGTPSPFVFPGAADRYARNANGLYLAVKPYFARAVYGDNPADEPTNVDANGNPETPRELADVIDGAGFTDAKRTRLLDVYARIKAGERSKDIAAALNVARSQVSMDLREIERLTGEPLRPMASKMKARANWWAQIDRTRAERKIGSKAASLYGWHSLRATFVVLALEAGVPLADVQKVVGHSTAEMTLQYFNPETKHAAERVREQMRGTVLDGKGTGRKMIGNAAPAANAPAPAVPSIDAIIAGMSKRQKQAFMNKLIASM